MKKIAIIGLGYVGLPLAIEFGKIYSVVGFDINQNRISELNAFDDKTNEVTSENLRNAKNLKLTSDPRDLKNCNIYIVTVPTPVDENNTPDLTALRAASLTVGKLLNAGDIVIFESTVYPGATEEICIPELETASQLLFNRDFFVGYSPERLNPGDKINTITNIKKITSGSDESSALEIDKLYASIIEAGTYRASSIKVAEAAKVIENVQRDMNIAIVNEFAKIFNLLNIDTHEVLEAASTKWNFLNFKPGLVGGHCISVDPYYLTHKALDAGYRPEVILSGRRINNGMAQYVAVQLVRKMVLNDININGAKVLVLGFTFKGNCPDIRNTKIIDLVRELESFGCSVDISDSWADPTEVRSEYGIELISKPAEKYYDGIVLAVDHSEYKDWGARYFRSLGKQNHILYDIKNILPKALSDIRL